MTLKKLLVLKALAVFCTSISNAQVGLDPFAIYHGSPFPPSVDHLRSHAGFGESILRSHSRGRPFTSSNLIVGDLNSLKLNFSLPIDDDVDVDYREELRNDDDYGPPPLPRPKYFDKPSNRLRHPEDKQERRPQSSRPSPRPNKPHEQLPEYHSSSSNESPMIFAFRLGKRMWEDNLRNRVNSLQNVNFFDEMEDYAEPSNQVSRILNWFRGRRGKHTKPGPNTDHHSGTPFYHTHTETIIDTGEGGGVGGNPNFYSTKKPFETPYPVTPHSPTPTNIPPKVFRGHVHVHDHHEHVPDHYPGVNVNDDSKGPGIPPSNILKQSAGKGRPNFNPKCDKGGSMIFCNSDALMALLDLLEGDHANLDGQNVKFSNYDRFGPLMIEIIEIDPYDNQPVKQNKRVPQRSKDFNEIHDVDIEDLNGKYNSHSSYGSSGFGIQDPNKEVDIVMIVHTNEGSFGKSNYNKNEFKNYNYGNGNIGGKNGEDIYRKPFRHFDDDELQNSYDKKFDWLTKMLAIAKQRYNNNNNAGAKNYGWQKDNHLRENQYQHQHGLGDSKNNYQRGNQYRFGVSHEKQYGQEKEKGPAKIYQFGNYIPLQNAKYGPPSHSHSHSSHKKPRQGKEEDPNPNYFNNDELYIDLKDDDYYNYDRERNTGTHAQGKRTREQYFGLASAGKSKHASKQEKEAAIRKKIEQIYVRPYSHHSRN